MVSVTRARLPKEVARRAGETTLYWRCNHPKLAFGTLNRIINLLKHVPASGADASVHMIELPLLKCFEPTSFSRGLSFNLA